MKASDVLQLLLWTGARKSEATGAEWRELGFRAKLWTVPVQGSKTGEIRRIPLPLPAFDMLRSRRKASPEGRWISLSPVGAVGPLGSPQAVARRAQARSGVTGWTVHDLRRVVRSGLSALAVAPSGR
ncbi:MAG TPA: tyrosine-type recombinase/integrase [Thermoanaerobaculia bacterium]|nr:tyrosine-type recombinase/integrase [Thermoanaerobaculia bacterium]